MASETVSQTIDAHTRLYALLGDFSGIGSDILVNTTSVGMAPKIDRMPIVHACLRPGMTVMDIVYNPLETKLLKAARKSGCTVVDGVACSSTRAPASSNAGPVEGSRFN